MEALTDGLHALFASSAATYEKFEARSGFSAAAARQINNVGAKLYYGAKRAAARASHGRDCKGWQTEQGEHDRRSRGTFASLTAP